MDNYLSLIFKKTVHALDVTCRNSDNELNCEIEGITPRIE